jgi:hypothetical protein
MLRFKNDGVCQKNWLNRLGVDEFNGVDFVFVIG